MNFYKKQHNFYCGINLHAKNMYICIIDSYGNVKLHKNFKTSPDELLKTITPFNHDLVIAYTQC